MFVIMLAGWIVNMGTMPARKTVGRFQFNRKDNPALFANRSLIHFAERGIMLSAMMAEPSRTFQFSPKADSIP
jgi:hypothetical protein